LLKTILKLFTYITKNSTVFFLKGTHPIPKKLADASTSRKPRAARNKATINNNNKKLQLVNVC
jgi:hypothetical protein